MPNPKKKRCFLESSSSEDEHEQQDQEEDDLDEDEEEEDDDDEGEKEYDVEKVVGWRYRKDINRKEFYIKWIGWSDKDNTWEPERNLSCPKKIEEFVMSLSEEERKLLQTSDPTKLNGFQRNANLKSFVGVDGPRGEQDPQPFHILLKFDDYKFVEELTLMEYFHYKPAEALNFCEMRLLAAN